MCIQQDINDLIKLEVPWWYIIYLPEGIWGAVWSQPGKDTEIYDSIFCGDYKMINFIGDKDELINGIEQFYIEHNERYPENQVNIIRIKSKIIRYINKYGKTQNNLHI